MLNPLVSLIIPTYNRADLIIETLNSIKSQTYSNWECIIVDDNSTDDTEVSLLKYCKLDKRFQYYKRPMSMPKGANSCRNYGLNLSKGSYIQFFDSDDIMAASCLEVRVSEFSKTDVDFLVFSMGLLKNQELIKNKTKTNIVNTWEEALTSFLGPSELPWNTLTVMFRASLLKGKIAYNENLMRFQDIEFNIRLLTTLKPTFLMIPITDCYYRIPSVENAKPPQFYLNVFDAVPEYYRSLQENIPSEQFHKNVNYFQDWIFNLTSLYTRKNIPFKLYLTAIKSARKYVSLNRFRFFVLIQLFVLKKYFRKIKGHTLVFNFLKSVY